MLAMTVSVTSVVQFSSASARGASYSVAAQSAKQTAEAGLNHAVSILATNMGNASALPACPPSEPPVGGVSWCGTKSGNAWTVKATSRMANPTGPSAAPVRRSVETSFEIVTTTDLSAWQGVLTWGQDEQPLMQDGAEIMTPLHVKPAGTYPVLIKGNSRYMGEYLAIDGALQILDTSSVGIATNLVNNVLVESGCNFISPCGPTPARMDGLLQHHRARDPQADRRLHPLAPEREAGARHRRHRRREVAERLL
jgi:hypothetical protein